MLQYFDHHVFVKHVQEKVGHHHVVLFELIDFHDVAVDATNAQVGGFFLLGFSKFAEHGFGQVDHGNVCPQLGGTDGVTAVANPGKQDAVSGLYRFDIQHGGFATVNVFSAVEVAQKIVHRADIFVLVVHFSAAFFLFPGPVTVFIVVFPTQAAG